MNTKSTFLCTLILTFFMFPLAALPQVSPKDQPPAPKFRLVFASINGDPKKSETLEFQLNTADIRQPSEFLKIGDIVPNTNLKITKFEFKETQSKGDAVDVSELTVTNVQTGESTVLVIGKVTDVRGAAKR